MEVFFFRQKTALKRLKVVVSYKNPSLTSLLGVIILLATTRIVHNSVQILSILGRERRDGSTMPWTTSYLSLDSPLRLPSCCTDSSIITPTPLIVTIYQLNRYNILAININTFLLSISQSSIIIILFTKCQASKTLCLRMTKPNIVFCSASTIQYTKWQLEKILNISIGKVIFCYHL